MHILWINEIADLTGGCERYIADTAGFLQERGYKNTLLYGVDGWTEPKFLSFFDYAFPMVDLARQIQEIKPDLIYIQRLTGPEPVNIIVNSGIPAMRFYHDHKLFCLREHKYTAIGHITCKKPIGIHCYPCLGFINRKDGFPGIQLTSLSAFEKEIAANRKLHAHIVGSQYMKDHLVAHGFNVCQIHVNPLYTTAQVQPGKPERKNFLYAGQLVRGKGIDIILQAFASLQTAHKLYICGSGRQEDEFKQLSSSLHLDDRVIWTGKIPKDELDQLYASSLCFLMPSRVPETFGLAGLEAMSFATPVIATRVGGMGEWLEDGHNGIFVEPNDANQLAVAMAKIADDKELRENMSAQAQKTFVDKFKPEFHINRLIESFALISQ